MSSIVPEADQNISFEIFRHIVPTNFKIAVQENAILGFNQFVKISDNRNSVIMSSHSQIVFNVFYTLFCCQVFLSLNLSVQRYEHKKPCANQGCTGRKVII